MSGVHCRLWTLIIFVAALFRVHATPITLAEIPFQYREGLLWIEVTIPQSDKPLNFLLDTGAGTSVIDLDTTKRLGLKLGREVTVRSVATTLPGHWQRVSAKAGNVQLPRDYVAVDLGKLSSSCERTVDGLIGADFFCENMVQIDFEAQKIRLLKREKRKKEDGALPLQLRRCGMRVPVTVNNGKRQWIRLDTGCASALQWVTSDVDTRQCSRQTAIGLAAISIPQATTTVCMGDYKFADVPTGLHETAIFPGEAGLLGNGLLSQFSSITIDARAGRLLLEKRRSDR